MKILNTMIGKNGNALGFAMIDPTNARELWPEIEQHAQMALEFAFDSMTAEHVLQWIVSGRLILVVITVDGAIKASLTIEICDNDDARLCHIMTIGGENMEAWVHDWLPIWKAIGQEMGADYITIKGRAGWARYARRYGNFEHMYTQMRLKIENPRDVSKEIAANKLLQESSA